MKKIVEFVKERGLLIMMTGMLTVIAGVVAYMVIINSHMRNAPNLKEVSMALVFVGLGVYVVGRVSVSMAKRRAQVRERYGRSSIDDDDDDDGGGKGGEL